MSHSPVFLLSSERSGSNLLRRRVGEHQAVYSAPVPAHLLKVLHLDLPYYGDLARESSFAELVEDCIGLCQHHFSPWQVDLTPNRVLAEYSRIAGNDRNLAGVLHVLYTLHAEDEGRVSYFCKENDLFDFYYQLRASIDGARFIYLHRDPRDSVLSQRKRPTQTSSLCRLAMEWRVEQLKCLALVQAASGSERILTIGYEEILRDERRVINQVCSFLGVPATGSAAHAAVESTETHDWKNLDKPTMTDNVRKYEKEASPRELELIESIVWAPMNILGYAPVCDSRPEITPSRRELEIQLAYLRDRSRKLLRNRKLTPGQKDRHAYIAGLRRKFA